MKIAVFNPQMGRFMADAIRELSREHEVREDRYYNPELVLWADVAFFFTVDNNIKSATNPGEAILADDSNFQPWDLHDMDLTNKRIIVMPVDIEVWLGHQHGVKWDVVTDVIFPAKHIREMIEPILPDHIRTHDIKFGVDTEKYNFVDKPTGTKIAWVCEKWPTKGIDYALQIMALLPREYELHTIGGWNDRQPWEKAYQEDFIERNKIKFIDYEWVEDQNEWLADKDYILSCSKKEAFGYNIAEGMSKGLVPIIHRFYGCDDLWNINVWDTVDEAAAMIKYTAHYDKSQYRQYLFDKGYDLDTFVGKLNKVIKGE